MIKTDAILRQDVLNELNWEPSVVETHIGVTVNGGIVSLLGHVPTFAEKNGAEDAVKRVSGVKAIVNDLEVKLSPHQVLSDEDIAEECLVAIQANCMIPKDSVRVLVENRWVTLDGTVTWQFQRTAAYNSVCSLLGVAGVINSIKLKSVISDANVKQKIFDALKRRAELDAKGVKIETDNNKVVLRGSVHSWAERDEVEKAVWAAPGVAQVENDLEVVIP